MLTKGDLLSGKRPDPDGERLVIDAVSKALWYGVWGGMAFVAVVNSLAPHSFFPGKYCLLFGVLLAAAAGVQLALGVSFLHQKEVALAVVVLLLFSVGQSGLRLPASGSPGIDFSACYVGGHLASEHPPGKLYYQAVFPDGRISPLASSSEWQEIALRYGVSRAITFVYPPFFADIRLRCSRSFICGAEYRNQAEICGCSLWCLS